MAQITVSVLAVIPYEGMREEILHAGEAFPSLKLQVITGNLEEGAELVRQTDLSSYDAIVSRGGTAELIRCAVNLPVIEIHITIYDVLRAIRLASAHFQRYAVIGFPNVTETAHTLCRLLHNDVRIETVRDARDVGPAIDRLVLDDCQAIVCDTVCYQTALGRNLNAFLIASGPESLHDALSMAQDQGKIWHEISTQQQFMNSVLLREGIHAAILEADGSLAMARPQPPSGALLANLRSHLAEACRGNGTLRFYFNDQHSLYSVRAWRTVLNGRMVCAFSWQMAQIPLRTDRLGIRSLSAMECEHLFSTSFYATAGAMGSLSDRIEGIAQVRQPVMIYGEAGTGKEAIARALYLRGPLTRAPYITVDCALLDDKGWRYLLNHHTSPLNDSNETIYFQHMESIGDQARNELLSIIQDTDLSRRMRMLFSCDCPMKSPLPPMIQQLAERLGCAMLYLPPLRTRLDELPSLAEHYLQYLVTQEGKGLAGLESNAIMLLREYDWPGNYSQLKRVLNELAAVTPSGYISSDDAAQLLARERSREQTSTGVPHTLSLPGRTLEELTLLIVQETLDRCGGNQTLAAKCLGISRTTLWRYLSRNNPNAVKSSGG